MTYFSAKIYAATDTAEAKGIALANDILAGNLPLADWPIFTDRDWHHAAQIALDCDDYADLLAMVDEQDEADREEERLRRAAYSGRAPMHRDWMEA